MPIDFSNIKTTKGREYREEDINEINDSLYYLPDKQRASVLASIIEESGGDPLAKSKSGLYQGLLQWGPDRYRIKSGDRRKELKNQLKYLKNTIYNTADKKSWTHGGAGSGYDSFAEPFTKFHSTDLPLDSVYRGFSYGYVRPEGKEDAYQNRLKVAKQVLDRYPKIPDYLSAPETFSKIAFENMGVSTTKAEGGPIETPKRKMWHELSQAEKAEMMKVAIRRGITRLQTIRKKYNEFAEEGNIHDNTTMPTQQMQTDATYVNTPIAPVYSPVHQLPEVTVRPDSNLSPAERVLAERARKQAHDRAFGKGSYDAYRRREQTDYLIDKAARPTNVDKALDYAASLVSGIGQGADIASMTMGGLPVYSALKGAKALSEKDYVDGAMWMTPMLGVAGKKVYDAAKRAIEKVEDVSAYANSQKNAATQLKTRMSDPKYAHIIKDNSNPSFMVEGEPIYLEGLDPKAQATKTFFQDKISKLPIKPSTMLYLHTDVSNALRNHMPFALPYSKYAYIPKKEKTLAKQYIASVTDNKTRQHQYSIIKAHEGAHVYSCPKKPSPLSPYIDGLNINYFTYKNDAELAARGSQIKNYFDKKKINATELKYAADHYVQDTGIDNNMTEMFDYLRQAAKKNPKIWKKQAAWISNTSPAISFGLYNLQKND